MIYKCFECGKLYREEDGAMVYDVSIILISAARYMAFKCKNCFDEKTRKQIERINRI